MFTTNFGCHLSLVTNLVSMLSTAILYDLQLVQHSTRLQTVLIIMLNVLKLFLISLP